jgi:hypothetical protein
MGESQVQVSYGVLPPQREAIRLFAGVGENTWNGLPVEAGRFACISPVYGRGKRKREARSYHGLLENRPARSIGL